MGLATTLIKATTITDDGNSQTVTSVPFRGALFTVTTSGVTGTLPTLDLKFQVLDDATGDYATVASFPQITGNSKTQAIVYPGATGAIYQALPGSYRISWELGGTSPSFTLSIGANYLL